MISVKSPILVPYLIPHYQGVPDMEKALELVEIHSAFIHTQRLKFSYNILIGDKEIKVIFSIQKKEIQ